MTKNLEKQDVFQDSAILKWKRWKKYLRVRGYGEPFLQKANLKKVTQFRRTTFIVDKKPY
jgi:hypothetical protein